MSFKSIGDLAISVLAKLDIEEPGTERSTVKCAHPSGPRSERGEGTPAPRSENGLPVYIAPRTGKEGEKPGLRTRGRTENGKGTATEAAAKLTREERQSEDTRGRICEVNRSLSYRKHTLTVLPAASASRHVSSARPTRCVGSHLKLVWSH